MMQPVNGRAYARTLLNGDLILIIVVFTITIMVGILSSWYLGE
jgi:hypothetical protein